jgi:hypothetical protein
MSIRRMSAFLAAVFSVIIVYSSSFLAGQSGPKALEALRARIDKAAEAVQT